MYYYIVYTHVLLYCIYARIIILYIRMYYYIVYTHVLLYCIYACIIILYIRMYYYIVYTHVLLYCIYACIIILYIRMYYYIVYTHVLLYCRKRDEVLCSNVDSQNLSAERTVHGGIVAVYSGVPGSVLLCPPN